MSQNTTVAQRQEFLNWIIATIPAIEDYFGLDHIKQWVQDGLSREYNLYYDQWVKDPKATYGSFVARLTGKNPNYAKFMAKQQNSGDTMRAEIAVIQKALDQTQEQIDMFTAQVQNKNTTSQMYDFATSILPSFQAQKQQISATLQSYQKTLSDGIANGSLQ